MSKTLALKTNIVPINPKPWNKYFYVDKIADQVIIKMEKSSFILLNDLAEDGNPHARKILMQAWKELAEEEGCVIDDE